jgi:hypothetical protein
LATPETSTAITAVSPCSIVASEGFSDATTLPNVGVAVALPTGVGEGVRVAVGVRVGVLVGHSPEHGVGVGGISTCTSPPAVWATGMPMAFGCSSITFCRLSAVCPLEIALKVKWKIVPLPLAPGMSIPCDTHARRASPGLAAGAAH